MSSEQQYFYQIVGYKGHILPRYWNSKVQSKEWHEFAQEEPAVDAIAGPDSPLWVTTDHEGNNVPPFVELVLGVKSWGAISLLIPQDEFMAYVKPRMGYISPTRACPDPYSTSQYMSLSPIRFTDATKIKDLLKDLRPKKPSQRGGDDSKLNKEFMESYPKPGRGRFEQARLLWYILIGERADLPSLYGLPPLPSSIRLAYLSHTPWIDPHTFDISQNEEEQSLDIGWYEPGTDLTKHFVIDDYSGLTKTSMDKSPFAHGESTTIPGSELSSALAALLNSATEPLVLVTHDWPRTARLLQTHKIDTTGTNWHEGVGKLLGFERPRNGEMQAPRAATDRRHDDRRPGPSRQSMDSTRTSSIDLDSKHVPNFEYKVKTEVQENKPRLYQGRYDPSSPTRERSFSPRSRTRPLANTEDRHYNPKRLFRPDEDDGEIEDGQLPDDSNATQSNTGGTTTPQIYVIDIRELFTTLITTTRLYTLYPPMARRLGIQVEGWCAGNQARQMHDVLRSLVGGSCVYQREEELKKTPGVEAPVRTDASGGTLGGVPVALEGIAGQGGQKGAYYDSDDSDDDY